MLLSLEQFRRVIGWQPWHFWGLANSTTPQKGACGILRQYNWQDADAVGRDRLMEVIESAERKLQSWLGYPLAPQYIHDEVHSYPQYYEGGYWRGGSSDAYGHIASIRLDNGYVQAIGAEVLTLQTGAAVAITPSDEDNDGLDETFTATFATTETDPTKIVAYIPAASRLDNEGLLERYKVHLANVTIAAGTATVKGRYWQCVKPVLVEGVSSTNLNPGTAANFVTSLEFYVRSFDGDDQATLYWEAYPYPAWAGSCCGGAGSISTDPAAIASATARVGIRDAKLGLVIPGQAVLNNGTWTGASFDGCAPPARVVVRYQAGLPLDRTTKQMEVTWQQAIARLALAELGNPLCACKDRVINQDTYHWQFDVSRAAGANDEQYAVSGEDLNNPFGTRRGHIDAWKKIKYLNRILPGVAV